MTTLVRQLVKFGLVGLTNAAISLVCDAALLGAGVPYLPATVLAFAAGATNGYVWNRRWTFGAADGRRPRIAYCIVQATGLVATVALVALIVTFTQLGHLPAYLAAAITVTAATFLANRGWTFRERAAAAPVLS